jgi:hypothetical protein
MIDLTRFGCYWILQDLFMAGRHPVNGSNIELHPAVHRLVDMGMRCFINLTHPSEGYLPDYAGVLDSIRSTDHGNLQYHRFGILDYDLPSAEMMIQILNIIDENLEQKNPVYLHCHAGRGRTGTVVGCWLVRHGAQPDQALDQIADLRVALPVWMKPSPETEEQRKFIQSWAHGK